MYSILTDKDNDISQDISSTNTCKRDKGTRALSNKAPLVSEQPCPRPQPPNPKYLFENFVEGSSNKLTSYRR